MTLAGNKIMETFHGAVFVPPANTRLYDLLQVLDVRLALNTFGTIIV